MYETYFGLSHRPFAAVPRVEHFFAGAKIEAARQTLARCMERGEGVGVIVGPAGTGKSLLCQMLAEQFKTSLRVVLLCRNGLTTRRALMQAILYDLGQPYRGLDEGELRLALIDFVTRNDRCPRGMLLVVDEAERLPVRLLDEIRALTNLAADGQPRVRLLLSGGAALEERLASPKLESFSQRIVARCYLEGFNRTETEQFIRAQMAAAGGSADGIFSTEACEAVYRATDGVPRLVNQLCDHSLLLACAASQPRIEAACVEEAWADLQQLPTPWNGEPATGAANDNIIEFGGLDDEPAAAVGAAPSQAGSGSDGGSDNDPHDTIPMLRITTADDEIVGLPASPPGRAVAQARPLPLERLEPLGQLRRIEDALISLDDDFEPAGSIEPEVELIFSDPANPFSERFEEEEIIVEQNSVLAGGFSRRPPPAHHDVLAAPLAGRPVGAGSREARAMDGGAETTLVMPSGTAVDAGVSLTVVSTARRTESVPLSADAAYRVAQPLGGGRAVAECPVTMPASQLDASGELQRAAEEDADLIQVEEGYDDNSAPPPRPVTPVRHFEYRRLFARLRHG